MSTLLTATISIKGIRPLLWNAFTLKTIPLENTEKTGVPGNDPQEWRRSMLVTSEGQLYVENTYAFGCLRDGAKFIKQGRSSIQNLVVASLQVLDQPILTDRFLPNDTNQLITDPTAPVYLDIRSVKNPSTPGRNIRYRVAAAPGWQMTFHILWDATLVNRDQMKAVAIEAGRLSGIGDGRKIGFGRFAVLLFEVKEWIVAGAN